jgi:hypothetical protein
MWSCFAIMPKKSYSPFACWVDELRGTRVMSQRVPGDASGAGFMIGGPIWRFSTLPRRQGVGWP